MMQRGRRAKGAAEGAILEAVRVPTLTGTEARAGRVAYVVVAPPTVPGDRRGSARRRTRLRSAKIVDIALRFMIECLVYDRAQGGARLRLLANVDLPHRFRVYDDQTETFTDARIAWRAGRNIGVRFQAARPGEPMPGPFDASRCRRFYAVGR